MFLKCTGNLVLPKFGTRVRLEKKSQFRAVAFSGNYVQKMFISEPNRNQASMFFRSQVIVGRSCQRIVAKRNCLKRRIFCNNSTSFISPHKNAGYLHMQICIKTRLKVNLAFAGSFFQTHLKSVMI